MRTAPTGSPGTPARRWVAARAAALARPGSAVGITAGPLAAALAEQLAAVPALTVVTNCHAAAMVLNRLRRTDQSTILLGGTQTRGGAYTGALTVAAADHLLWGRVGLATVIPLAAPHILVTDVADTALRNAAPNAILVA